MQQKKIEAFNKLVETGTHAWISEEEVQSELERIPSEVEKSKILLAQLNFYKYVCETKCPAELFYKTKINSSNKRVERPWNELQQSLLQVIGYNQIPKFVEKTIFVIKTQGAAR